MIMMTTNDDDNDNDNDNDNDDDITMNDYGGGGVRKEGGRRRGI